MSIVDQKTKMNRKNWMQTFMEYHEVDCCYTCLHSRKGEQCFHPDITGHWHDLMAVEPSSICKKFSRREMY
jgi:hypothetical protein